MNNGNNGKEELTLGRCAFIEHSNAVTLLRVVVAAPIDHWPGYVMVRYFGQDRPLLQLAAHVHPIQDKDLIAAMERKIPLGNFPWDSKPPESSEINLSPGDFFVDNAGRQSNTPVHGTHKNKPPLPTND